MIKIEFTGQDLGEIQTQIENFLNSLGGATVVNLPAKTAAKTAATSAKSAPAPKKVSLDDLREALSPVGSPAQKKALIATFMNDKGTPAAKFSEIKEEDYPAVLEAIKELEDSLNL